MFKKIAVGLALVSSSVSAFAVGQDYSGITAALTTEITSAMPTVLAVFGMVAAIGIAFRLIKRATHA